MSMNLKNNNNEKSNDAIGNVTGFFLFRNLINKYNENKDADEETRKNIKKYGNISIILSIIALIVSSSCLSLNMFNLGLEGFANIMVMIVSILGGILIAIVLALYGFVFGVLQVRLNRKACGVFGLILSIIAIISCILLIVFLII